MKKNVSSIIATLLEYLVLIAPTAGYSIYCYVDTLQYTMTPTSKGTFWTVIGFAILAAVIYGIFKKKYDRYVQGYVQQKTDLETNPTNELLIKKVAEKKIIIENLDYVVAAIPVAIAITVVKAFQGAIDQLLVLLEIVLMSLAGKVCMHILSVELAKKGMIGNIGGDE